MNALLEQKLYLYLGYSLLIFAYCTRELVLKFVVQDSPQNCHKQKHVSPQFSNSILSQFQLKFPIYFFTTLFPIPSYRTQTIRTVHIEKSLKRNNFTFNLETLRDKISNIPFEFFHEQAKSFRAEQTRPR